MSYNGEYGMTLAGKAKAIMVVFYILVAYITVMFFVALPNLSFVVALSLLNGEPKATAFLFLFSFVVIVMVIILAIKRLNVRRYVGRRLA